MGTIENWEVPRNTDTIAIYQEALSNFRQRRYALALKKYRWLYSEAPLSESHGNHVRNSFCLLSWLELGKCYPVALEELLVHRDVVYSTLLRNIFDDQCLSDVIAINLAVEDFDSSLKLFLHIESLDKNRARAIYQLFEPALLALGEYNKCQEYVDFDSSYENAISNFRRLITRTSESTYELTGFAEKKLGYHVSVIVFLLVNSNQLGKAKEIAKEIKQELGGNEEVMAIIHNALNGNAPNYFLSPEPEEKGPD